MQTRLFNWREKKSFTVEFTKPSEHGHSFGGPSVHEGCETMHLLYRLNLEDLRIGITLPEVKWLPLYHPFKYNGSDLGYFVRSDSQVEIVKQSCTEVVDDFPFENYPALFQRRPVSIYEIALDEWDFCEAYWHLGIFGKESLTEKQRSFCMRVFADYFSSSDRGERAITPESASKMSLEDMMEKLCGSETDFGPFVQGRPECPCVTESCSGVMKCICSIESDDQDQEGLPLWGDSGNSAGVQMFYLLCSKCKLIYTYNEV